MRRLEYLSLLLSFLQVSKCFKVFKSRTEPSIILFCEENELFAEENLLSFFNQSSTIELEKCSVDFTKRFVDSVSEKQNVVYSDKMSKIVKNIFDLCSIRGLKHLRMEIDPNGLEEKWPNFTNCQEIKSLEIQGKQGKQWFEINEVSFSGLTKLEKLSLRFVPIKSLKIKNFRSLKTLKWQYDKCYQKSRILPDISNLREFHYYQAEQNNCLVKLNFDSDKSNLEKLSIRNTQLGSEELLQFSSQFQNLKELKLQDNRIEDLDILQVEKLNRLENLYLASNPGLVPECEFIEELNQKHIEHDLKNCKLQKRFGLSLVILVPIAILTILFLVFWRLWKHMKLNQRRKSCKGQQIVAFTNTGIAAFVLKKIGKYFENPRVTDTEDIQLGANILEDDEKGLIYQLKPQEVSKISNVAVSES